MPQAGGFGKPAGNFSADQFRERFDVVSPVVKTGDIGETLTGGLTKYVGILFCNLFSRFQTIHRKTGTDQVNLVRSVPRQRTQGFIDVWL